MYVIQKKSMVVQSLRRMHDSYIDIEKNTPCGVSEREKREGVESASVKIWKESSLLLLVVVARPLCFCGWVYFSMETHLKS